MNGKNTGEIQRQLKHGKNLSWETERHEKLCHDTWIEKLWLMGLQSMNKFDMFNHEWMTCTQTDIQCESKNPPWGFLAFFRKWLGIFSPNFTHLLHVPIYAGLQIFIQLSAILTELCHIKRDHPVVQNVHHRPKRTLAFSAIFPKQQGIFGPNFAHLLDVPVYARL